MRNGKLSKRELQKVRDVWDIMDRFVDYKEEVGEDDDATVYASRVTDAISWFLGEIEK